jgi:predicted metal-binding protein
MKKIAIITCSNVKNELGCPAVGCLAFLNARKGSFARYGDGLELVGMATCAGCPTLLAPKKILTRIKPLVELAQAQAIHLSTCMVSLCPFVKKYESIIKEKYPEVEIVKGTDQLGDEALIGLAKAVKKMLTHDQPDITGEYLKAISHEELMKAVSDAESQA